MNKIALTVIVLALTALAGVVASRWAFDPLGFHTIVGPAHKGDAELIREYWPHRLIQPEWVSRTPDTFMNWSLTEASVRLCIVAAVWLFATAGLVVGYRRHRKRAHNKRPGVDAGWRVLFAFQRHRPRATQAGR